LNTTLVIANIISLIGCVVMVAIGLINERKKILLTQCVQWTIMSISNLMLGGITAVISNTISIARNLYSIKKPLTMPIKLLIIAAQLSLTIAINKQGLLGWLPAIGVVTFTLFLDVKDEKILKLWMIFGQTLWAIFDISLKNYTAFAFDIFTIISTLIGIWKLLQKKHKE